MNLQLARWFAAPVREGGPSKAKALSTRQRRDSFCPRLEVLEDRTPPSSVSGEAFGAFIDLLTVLSVHVSVPKRPDVVLPSKGGMVSDYVLGVDVPGVFTSNTLAVITSGAIGAGAASSQSSATVDTVNILGGVVTANLVVAMSSSTSNGNSATSNADGSTLIGLTVGGDTLGDITPAPNTRIDITGVGYVVLNEQIAGGDGKHSSSLTVNMIHVYLNDVAATGDIIVASAHSDVNFKPAPKSGPVFMTGGGRLGEGRDLATFGFNAGRESGGLKGQLQYIDHARGLNIHSTSITSFSHAAGSNCVSFAGTARVNGTAGYTFTVTEACDNGEPGVGTDTFAISVSGTGVSYSRSGVLTGGNLQLHAK